MAEQQKESSPADSKEKNSLLDDEIGNEFLGSWKSMSMADDDAMDFSFDTVSKSKKNTFDFEKLDMNFNLDSEFEKISSFKVDMSDLDFTSPPKKSTQSTEKKGEASGAKAGKQDGFSFNFDFNELDSFNLDSSLLKVDTNVDSHQRKKGITTEGNDNKGAKKPKIIDDEGVHASSDNMAMKPQTSERVETLEVEISVGNQGNLDSRQDDSVSKISSSGNLDIPIKNQISGMSKSTSIKEIDQERDLPEKTKSTESKYEQVINKVPSQSVGQSDTEQDTISEQHTKVFSSGTRVNNVSGDKQEVNDEATFVDSAGVDLQLEHSSPPLSESDGSVREALNLGRNAKEGVTNDPKTEQSYTSCENITKTDALRKNSCDIIRENKISTLECHHLATTSSKPVVDKITLVMDKELQVVQSNMFSMPEYKSSLRHPSSTAGTKSVSFDLRSITLRRDSFKSNDAKFGSKTVSESLPGSSKPERDAHAPAMLGSKDDPKSCSNARDSFKSSDAKFGSKTVSNSLPGSSKPERDAHAPAMLGSKDDLKSCSNARESFKSSDVKFGSKTVSDSLPGSSKPVRDAHAPALLGSRDDPKSCTNARDSFKSSDAKFGSKTVSNSLPGSSKPVRNAHAPALLGSKDDLKSCSNARVDNVFDVTVSAEKLAGNMLHEEVNTSKGIILETGTPTKDANILSSEANPDCFTEKTAKITTQISVNSQPESSGKESIQRSRITSLEGNKLSSFKACKITPAFPSLKISSNIGANAVLATSLHQKEANSLISFEKTKEIHGIKASKSDHLTDSGSNQKPLTPFLKRKSIEVSQADLTSLRSLKRLSQSPCESRNSKESSEKAAVQVESKSNDFLYNYSTSGLQSPSEIKAAELEMTDFVLMEDNGNVEKAEAYMKELDNICNMLKKRHEEAKELLVRAIVNDNNLLMLNHPIHEEEIRKVQKFASQLMSKTVQT